MNWFLFLYKRTIDSSLEPYKQALLEIDAQIGEQMEKVASVKRKILLNEDKISKLIFNIGKKS